MDGGGQRIPSFCKDSLFGVPEACLDSVCAESEPIPRETPGIEDEAGLLPLADVVLVRTVVTPWPQVPV